jgi:hypothetical protein
LALNDDQLNNLADEIMEKMPPEIISWMKHRFFDFVVSTFGQIVNRMEVGIVIDTNQILKAVAYRAKTGKEGWLEQLLSHPMFNIQCPAELFIETEKNLQKLTHESKISLEKLRRAWMKIKTKVKKCLLQSTHRF